MIDVDSLLVYYQDHPNYEVKQVKGSHFNIEFHGSLFKRKNVLAELYPKTGRFYLNKHSKWISINNLPEIKTNEDVISWIEKDSQSLRKRIQ